MKLVADLVIIHRDQDWLAVHKPSGIPTTAPASAKVTSLVDRVRTEILGDETITPHPLSRLDVEVTGIVLFALSTRARGRAIEAREKGKYARRYVAITSATPSPGEGTWNWTIGVDPRDRTKRVAASGIDPVAATTHYAVLETAAPLALVQLDLETGRTHQIRVHAAKAGCAIVGDRSYGGPRHVTRDDGSVITARRVMLHARAVKIPMSHKWLEAAFDEDWVAFWGEARG